MLSEILQDVRYGWRMLARSPGVATVAALSLAIGIGANSTIFSFLDVAYFRPLPVRDPAGLVRVFTTSARIPMGDSSHADYLDFRDNAQSLSGLAAEQHRGPLLTVDGATQTTLSYIVSDDYFTVLGIVAANGRVFAEPAKTAPPAPVIVLSHRFWQKRFGGDPSAVGRTVAMNSLPFTIIGIAPPEFAGLDTWSSPDLWMPMSAWDLIAPGERGNRRTARFTLIGRLKPDATVAQARTEIETIARRLAREYPATNRDRGAVVMSQFAYQLQRAGTTAGVLAGIVGFVLLIACANVAGVLMARSEARRREIAIRLAVGSGRGRLVRQLLTENALLGLFGTLGALALSAWLIDLLPTVIPAELRPSFFRLDLRVLFFTVLLSGLTLLLSGLFPALQAARAELAGVLKDAGSVRRSRAVGRHALVAGQIALSLVVLSAGGLLVRSLLYTMNMNLGFARKNVLLARLYPDLNETAARNLFAELEGRLRALPGVVRVTSARRAPLWPSEGGYAETVSLPGYQSPSGETSFPIRCTSAGAEYFRLLGIRVMSGRDFSAQDTPSSRPVLIVNETFARRFWPNEDPLGRIVRVGRTKPTDREIVGIVRDAKIGSLEEPPEPYFYMPLAQDFYVSSTLLIETAGDPMALINPVKTAIAAEVQAADYGTLASLLSDQTVWRRSGVILIGTLGVIGTALALVGLYGLIAYTVARRTQEIGIRMALGANRNETVWLVVRHSLRVAGIGIAVGLIATLAAGRILSRALYGISAYDPLTLATVAAGLLLVSLIAAAHPARRASRVDPLTALRYE
jgi:predicted permease